MPVAQDFLNLWHTVRGIQIAEGQLKQQEQSNRLNMLTQFGTLSQQIANPEDRQGLMDLAHNMFGENLDAVLPSLAPAEGVVRHAGEARGAAAMTPQERAPLDRTAAINQLAGRPPEAQAAGSFLEQSIANTQGKLDQDIFGRATLGRAAGLTAGDTTLSLDELGAGSRITHDLLLGATGNANVAAQQSADMTNRLRAQSDLAVGLAGVRERGQSALLAARAQGNTEAFKVIQEILTNVQHLQTDKNVTAESAAITQRAIATLASQLKGTPFDIFPDMATGDDAARAITGLDLYPGWGR